MTFSRLPGEIKSFRMLSGEGLDREGLILKVNNDTATDPRMAKITASGDAIFGIGYADSYDQTNTLETGERVSVIHDGEALVAVESGTYNLGDTIYLADSNDGMGRKTSVGTKVGSGQEYKVVATGEVDTTKVNQLKVRLTFAP